jgi:hypothetical protein
VGRLVRGRRVGGGRNIRRCVRGVLYVFDICSVCVLVLLWFTMYIRDLGWDRMGWECLANTGRMAFWQERWQGAKA